MWNNLADILQKLAAKRPVKNWLLCVVRVNLRLKNSYIYAKILLSVPKITKTRKLQHYFPIIDNICAYHGHKNKQKDKNSMFSSIYIWDLNLPPIRFVQFVPRFVRRCRLYSFIRDLTIYRTATARKHFMI